MNKNYSLSASRQTLNFCWSRAYGGVSLGPRSRYAMSIRGGVWLRLSVQVCQSTVNPPRILPSKSLKPLSWNVLTGKQNTTGKTLKRLFTFNPRIIFAIPPGGITVNGKLNYARERESSCCLVSVFQNEIKSKVSGMFIRSLVYLFAHRCKKKIPYLFE